MIFKCPSMNPGGSAVAPATTEKIQTAMRYLTKEDMTAANWIYRFTIRCVTASPVHLQRGRVLRQPGERDTCSPPQSCSPRPIRPAAQKPVPRKKMGGIDFHYPAQET